MELHQPCLKTTIYLEVVDTVTTCITDRLAKESHQMYSKVERLLVEQDQTENEVAEILMYICSYNDDFEKDTLLTELQLFRTNFPVAQTTTIHDVVSIVKGMWACQ